MGVCGKVQVQNGEVFLKGTYIEMGLHASGTFGTVAPAPVSFNGAAGAGIKNPWPAGVGFSVDYNRDGYGVGSPTAFSGDYFLPGSPVEGVATSWRTTSTGTPTVYVNKGRMGKADVVQVRGGGEWFLTLMCWPVLRVPGWSEGIACGGSWC